MSDIPQLTVQRQRLLEGQLLRPFTSFLLMASFGSMTYLRTQNQTPITEDQIATELQNNISTESFIMWVTGGEDRQVGRNGRYLLDTILAQTTHHLGVVLALRADALDEPQIIRLIHACAQQFQQHGVSALRQTAYEPQATVQHLLAQPPVGNLHREPLLLFAIYQDLIQEACRALFALAQQQLAFTAETLLPSLQNYSQIHTLLTEAESQLSDLANIYQASLRQQQDDTAREFERQYRTALARKLDRITLFGAQMVQDYSQPLSIAYINLQLARRRYEPDLFLDGERSVILSTPDALSQANRLLIEGQAGAGKTTLLKWLAVTSARLDLPQPLTQWGDCVPLFLRLRDYAQAPLPLITQLPICKSALTHLSPLLPPDWVHQQLQAGRALVLLDGLDEVTASKRDEAYQWLEDALALYPQARYLVTTRPATLQDERVRQRFDRNQFTHLQLRPMQEEAVALFIGRWHTAMGDERCLLPEHEKAQLAERQTSLQQALQRQRHLRNLTRNPLLCAMLCALNRVRRSQLPPDRIQLYAACLEMFLEGRDRERKVDEADYNLSLTLREKEDRLARLAYWMMRNSEPVITRAKAVKELADDSKDGKRIFNWLWARSGMLQQESQEEFSFTHRTFQEYLAAKQIVYKEDYGFAIAQAHKEDWRETIRLLGGCAHTEVAQITILQKLLKKAEQYQDEEKRAIHGLAYETYCLMAQKSKSLTQLIKSHIQEMFFIESADTKIVWNGWKIRFKTLDLSDSQVVDLSPLRYFPDLESLYLKRSIVENISQIQHLKNLKRLSITETPITDFIYLKALTELRQLSIRDSYLEDLSPLSYLINLEQLYIGGSLVTDLSPINTLTLLKEISIRDTNIRDLSPLLNCHKLASIRMENTKVANLEILSQFKSLEFLDLQNTYPQSYTPLLQCENLKAVWVTDISVLPKEIHSTNVKINPTIKMYNFIPRKSSIVATGSINANF